MKFLSSAFLVFSLSVFLLPSSSPSIEIGTDFEGGLPPGFVVDGFGLRDVSSCQYGPQEAPSGIMCVGVPETCQPGYPNGNPDDYWDGFFATPEISLGDSFPSLYLRFTHWGDFEGVTDEFDGVIVELENVTQGTTEQIDPDAALELIPTYDAIIGTTNPPLRGLWAYCHDTRGGIFNAMGFPYASFTYLDPFGGSQNSVKRQTHSHSPMQFEWRAVQSVDLIAAGYAVQGDGIKIRWYFASDQLANGAGYFIDDVYISNLPPSDEQAPIIEVASPAPFADVATENVPVPVKAYVDDVGTGVLADSVFLVYRVEDGAETTVPMTSVAADTFTADVEALPYDTDVYYRVVAYDNAFNKGSSPTFTFEVTNAVTYLYDDGIPASVFPTPEIGSGFSNRFYVPADSIFVIHKVLFYMARENGLFDVIVNNGSAPGNPPGSQLARFEDVTNGMFASTFFQYELPDSVGILGPNNYFVGMRHVSEDTLLDPQPLIDGEQDYTGVCYAFFGGQWLEPGAETMIRVKVKKYEIPSGVEGDDTAGGSLPKAYALMQNFPNPFNPVTSIRYDVPEKAGSGVPVVIDIFNIHGQLVRNIVNETKKPGSYTVQWDGRSAQGGPVSSGLYFYRIKAGDFISTKKMVLLK